MILDISLNKTPDIINRRKFIRQSILGGSILNLPLLPLLPSTNPNWEENSILSPYENGYKYQYKVNLHAHTTERDKNYAYSPKSLLKKAKEYSFDAFAITDLPQAGGIVEDPGVEGILHIPGIEYGGRPHLIGLGIHSLTESLDKQKQINHIKSQGGLAYIPHPYLGYSNNNYDKQLITHFINLDGVAVFNSLTYAVAVSRSKGSEVIPYNEKIIDGLLSKNKSIAIISEEDTKYEDPHNYGHQLNTAWIKVWGNIPPTEISVNYILDAIKAKRFTSHGRNLRTCPEPPDFIEILTEGLSLNIVINKASDIEFITKGGEVQKVIKNSTQGKYGISPENKYVRVKVTYTENRLSSWAWTNPIYIY